MLRSPSNDFRIKQASIYTLNLYCTQFPTKQLPRLDRFAPPRGTGKRGVRKHIKENAKLPSLHMIQGTGGTNARPGLFQLSNFTPVSLVHISLRICQNLVVIACSPTTFSELRPLVLYISSRINNCTCLIDTILQLEWRYQRSRGATFRQRASCRCSFSATNISLLNVTQYLSEWALNTLIILSANLGMPAA